MSNLHGACTSQTLQRLLHIPEAEARRYVSHLVADGVLKQNSLVQDCVGKLANLREDSHPDTAESRPEPDNRAENTQLDAVEADQTTESPDAITKPPHEPDEVSVAGKAADDLGTCPPQ